MHITYVGVDVAKDWLDIFWPGRGPQRIANTLADVDAFARQAADEATRVIFEASGGYDAMLSDALARAGAIYSRVNPGRVRDFARAAGIDAKTDQLDGEP